MAKPRRPLTRDKVLDAALRILDKGGPAALTMRSLAAAVGVEAMSLYNHVDDKADLLSGVVDRVLSGIAPPDPALPWFERLGLVARGIYEALVAHPALVLIIGSEQGGPTDPQVLAGVDGLIAILEEGGLPPAERVNAFRGLLAMCFGFVVTHTLGLSTSKAAARKAWERSDAAKWTPEAYPHFARLVPQFFMTSAEDDFEFMLRAYLRAVGAPAQAAPGCEGPSTRPR